MTMDISDTLAPDSDQLDAIDLATGPRVFTVKGVSKGSAEQPVQVHLAEFPRGPWRPGKNMRRVLAACWGTDASAWAGRRVELYCDPDVTFGKETPGGTRIAKLSHIDKEQKIPLLVSRGKSTTYVVRPLPKNDNGAPKDADAGLAASQPQTTKALLGSMSAHAKSELYDRTGMPRSSNLGDVRKRLIAAADELGVAFAEEPDPHAILGAYRQRDVERVSPGDVEEFDRAIKTGEWLDGGDQATIDAEAER